MKVTGSPTGQPPEISPDGTDPGSTAKSATAKSAPAKPATPASETGSGDFQRTLAGGPSAPPVSPSFVADSGSIAKDSVAKSDLTAGIHADLSAGAIGREAALDRVIEGVLDRQLGTQAPAAVRQSVGASLRQALQDDPLLAEKVARLSGG